MPVLYCDWCGKEFERSLPPSKRGRHKFCCRKCVADFSNKTKNPDRYKELKDYTHIGEHLTALNKKLNPNRMTISTRTKLRVARLGSGKGKAYSKLYGRHEHRIAAEIKLGRSLRKGEVVHHIDGDIRNNSPENLMVFPSQAEHAKYHAEQKRAEVMPNEVHAP